MRTITDHKVNGLNEALEITTHEPATPGGAPNRYNILSTVQRTDVNRPRVAAYLTFQSQPISKPEDVNGISNESLLAVVMDRLRCWQEGPFKCRENAVALEKISEAMTVLHRRTRNRMDRGVEGTHTP